ncbi:hypothetical protein PR003_g1825 [Phytophthora rubi]|uniref:Uncharacterized protein n=1 Tax=Phytophthora rubi TaxID=129364 RepID=A0A6A4FUN0_9STRA|nr:hypothetical protein PR003_g1825 [Phytophthora rubi]
MVRKEETSEVGEVIYKNKTGVIRPWSEEQVKYYWIVEFDRQAAPDAKLDIVELAEVINYLLIPIPLC